MKIKSTIILIILLIPIRFVFAADTPAEIVHKFCELDFAGARLSSDRYETITPLVAYTEEPGWDIVIGITGSYGKTSTKEFLATILSEKFKVLKTEAHQNSEVGISRCILNDLKEEHEVFICEMGA